MVSFLPFKEIPIIFKMLPTGFYNSYGKKEYRKYLNFFGNGMENGEYLKYGHVHEQHERQNSDKTKGQQKTFEKE